jgi:HAD superfamily hydrolase (TIGR01509 family)
MLGSVVVFDMDGTLTKPILDFDAIRAEIGGIDGPILEALESLSPERRIEAQQIVRRHETDAVERAELYDGAVEVMSDCRSRGHAVAILTRNSRQNLNRIMKRFDFRVDASRTREDGAIKPSPDGILSICDEVGGDPRRSWMVGDYLFDILSGLRAGAKTVLMIGDDPVPDYADQAHHVISRLADLLPILDDTTGCATA